MLSHERAVELGHLSCIAQHKKLHERFVREYYSSPKACKTCGTIIPYEKRRNDYCNRSCRAKTLNIGIIRNKMGSLPRLSKEESRRRKRERNRKWARRRVESRKKELNRVFGGTCKICGYDRRISIHRKDGKNHESPFETLHGFESVIKHKEHYVAICYKCHSHVHWCMKYLNMLWEDIYGRVAQSG